MQHYPDVTLAGLAEPCTCPFCCPAEQTYRSVQAGHKHSPVTAQTCTSVCQSRICSGLQKPRGVPVNGQWHSMLQICAEPAGYRHGRLWAKAQTLEPHVPPSIVVRSSNF